MKKTAILWRSVATAVPLGLCLPPARGGAAGQGDAPVPAESLRVNYASGQGYGNRPLSWPGEIIVQFDPNVLPTERHRIVQDHDFANDDNHPDDDNGHGTHVTGTIAESTNNLIGVAGVAFRCSIMPVKVMDSDSVSDALRRFSRPLGRHVTTAGR